MPHAAQAQPAARNGQEAHRRQRHRKFEEIEKARAKAGIKGHVKMLTTCPGCLQGLSRYEERADMDAEYIVVEMARQILGANWRDQFIRTVKNGGIEKVLV